MLGAIYGYTRSMDLAYDKNNFTIVIPRWSRHIYGPIGNLY